MVDHHLLRILTDEQHLAPALSKPDFPYRWNAIVIQLPSKKRQLQRIIQQLDYGKAEAIYQSVEGAMDEEHIVDHDGRIGAGHAPERVTQVAVLDGGTAGHKEDGGEVVGKDEAAERRGDLGEADLLPGEEVEEQEPRGVLVGDRDEVAVRVEEGAAGEGQVVAPGEAEAVEAAEREVEERLGEGGEQRD